MTQLAYLGTGLLGSAFVEAAAKRGEQITVWNRTASKARALEAFGARVAATPADAVRGATSVHLVLKDDDVVDDVIAALRPGLAAAAIIMDHSTTQPARTASRSRRLNAEGVRYLHCPVFIGPAAARAAVIAARGKTMMSGDFTPAFELSMARKDVRLMIETADTVPLASLPGIAARMDALIAEGHGEEDLTVLGAESALASR